MGRCTGYLEYIVYNFNKRVNPTAGSPTVTLLRLHSSCAMWSGTCMDLCHVDGVRSTEHNPGYRYFHYMILPECDGRGVQGSGTYSPRRADPRLLVIPSL